MTKILKKSDFEKEKKIILTKLKNSNCEKIQKLNLLQNPNCEFVKITQIVRRNFFKRRINISLTKKNSDKSETQIVTKLINSNCDKT